MPILTKDIAIISGTAFLALLVVDLFTDSDTLLLWPDDLHRPSEHSEDNAANEQSERRLAGGIPLAVDPTIQAVMVIMLDMQVRELSPERYAQGNEIYRPEEEDDRRGSDGMMVVVVAEGGDERDGEGPD